MRILQSPIERKSSAEVGHIECSRTSLASAPYCERPDQLTAGLIICARTRAPHQTSLGRLQQQAVGVLERPRALQCLASRRPESRVIGDRE